MDPELQFAHTTVSVAGSVKAGAWNVKGEVRRLIGTRSGPAAAEATTEEAKQVELWESVQRRKRAGGNMTSFRPNWNWRLVPGGLGDQNGVCFHSFGVQTIPWTLTVELCQCGQESVELRRWSTISGFACSLSQLNLFTRLTLLPSFSARPLSCSWLCHCRQTGSRHLQNVPINMHTCLTGLQKVNKSLDRVKENQNHCLELWVGMVVEWLWKHNTKLRDHVRSDVNEVDGLFLFLFL